MFGKSLNSMIVLLIGALVATLMVEAEIDLKLYEDVMIDRRKDFETWKSCKFHSIGSSCAKCCSQYGEEMNGKNSELSSHCICTNQLYGHLYTVSMMKNRC